MQGCSAAGRRDILEKDDETPGWLLVAVCSRGIGPAYGKTPGWDELVGMVLEYVRYFKMPDGLVKKPQQNLSE